MIRLIALTTLVLLSIPCVASAQPERTTCPDTPEQGRETWVLEDLWRVGDDDSDEVIFGTISQAVVDDEGMTYVLDAQLAQIEVFDPDGAHVATLGGRGEGPGEFRIPLDMVLLPDGNLGVAEVFPGKLTVVTRDGTPAGVIELQRNSDGGFIQLMSCHAGGGHLVIGGLAWVLTSEARWNPRPGVLASYDVFTPGGRYVKIVDIVSEGRPASDQIVFGPGGRAVRITGYAEAMMTLLVRGVMDWTDEDVQPLSVVGCRRKE